MSRNRWYERIGPREPLTLTATCREVDAWRVAAKMAEERLADWAVLALNEAARAAIASEVSGSTQEPTTSAPAQAELSSALERSPAPPAPAAPPVSTSADLAP